MSDDAREGRLVRIEEELKKFSDKLVKIESMLYTNNGSKGLIEKFGELWQDFWRWHDETWIEFISKERRVSCFYLREKDEMRNKKKFSMAKFAFISKEIAQAVGTVVILLKLFGYIQ